MSRYQCLEGTDGTIGVESEGAGVGKQVVVGVSGQHGGQVVLLHLGGGHIPGGWL